MGERTKFVRENAKKHGIIGEKMTETERKFYQNSSKSWLSAVRSMETRGKKQLLPSNGNLYHYGGNNPVQYTDPDGKRLDLFFNKSKQTLTVRFRCTEDSTPLTWSFSYEKVTSNVVPGDQRTISTRDDGTLQSNGTKPTQFPNGDFNLTGTGKTSNSSHYGDFWITTDATQSLEVFKGDLQENGKYSNVSPVLDENGVQIYTIDGGYYIHFTDYTNTYGCIGVKTKEDMQLLLKLFEINKHCDNTTAKIHVSGNPEEWSK